MEKAKIRNQLKNPFSLFGSKKNYRSKDECLLHFFSVLHQMKIKLQIKSFDVKCEDKGKSINSQMKDFEQHHVLGGNMKSSSDRPNVLFVSWR